MEVDNMLEKEVDIIPEKKPDIISEDGLDITSKTEPDTTTKTQNAKIILSADSTCDLDSELKERYHVHYFPLHIILNGKDYRDNVDITPEQIYEEYYANKSLPSTAAVNVSEYLDYFRPWVEQGCEIIHINLGSALSSVHQNARLAASELDGVYPIDSCNLSTGTGLLVVAAGEMIQQGMSAREIAEALNKRTHKCHASFILDTLTFLSAGGRCSSLAALGANILKLKPCIEVDNRDGSMNVGKKYRGALDKVLVKYVKEQLSRYADINPHLIFITHSVISEEYIELVRKTVEENFHFEEIHVTKASCTISAHCGPNTLGILFETL